ncbi:hypothetical protein HY621_04380 [Candidatus Uhrbacteria bacterium]|nr:hypothetical protein [Candidatus Uhrbacteria bacterium]
MRDKPKNGVCEMCGGAHYTAEHQKAVEKTKEKKQRVYREVEGIRFEEGVPQSTIHAFLDLLRKDERRFEIDYKDNAESKCYAQLTMYHGSKPFRIQQGKEIWLPVVREPLTPFGLLSGYYSPEEISQKYRGKRGCTAIDTIGKADNPRANAPRITFAGTEQNMHAFQNFLDKNATGTRGETVEYIFEPLRFSKVNLRYDLPFLQTVLFDTHPNQKEIDLPAELSHTIQIKEMRDEGLTDQFGVPVIIDQQGWTLRKKS